MLALSEVLNLVPPSKRKLARLPGFYSLTWLPIAAGLANQPATVTTQNSSDFIALQLKAYVTTTANPPVEVTTPQLTLSIQVGSNNFMVDGVPIHVGGLAASASERRPFVFSFPWYIDRNTTLTASLTSLFNADLNVRIFLEGIRIMNYDAAK